MAQEQQTLAQIATFAFAQAQVRVAGEDIPLYDYASVANHLNDILVEWGAMGWTVPGFNRRAFRVAQGRSVYTFGPGGDLDTSLAVTEVRGLTLRFTDGWQFTPTRRESASFVPIRHDYGYRAYGLSVYAVTFDRDFVRLVFPTNLRAGDYIIPEYTTALGSIGDDLQEGDAETVRVMLPPLHLLALRYGIATRIAREYGAAAVESRLRREYMGKIELILNRNIELPSVQYDAQTLGSAHGRSEYHRQDGTSGGISDIGGIYQGEGSVIVNADHPDHPDFTSGTAHWGYITAAAADRREGMFGYRNGIGFPVSFPAPGETGGFLYVEAPAGSAVTDIRDESMFPVLTAWTRTGQEWRLGPLGRNSANRARSYIVTVDVE